MGSIPVLFLSAEVAVAPVTPRWHALTHGPLQVLAQAIKAAKEQHPDMSVTKVVVHQETEIAEEQ